MAAQKFLGKTLNEALARVKEALGENAVILKSEKIGPTGRLMRINGTDQIEVTAMIASEALARARSGPEFAENLASAAPKSGNTVNHSVGSFDMALVRTELGDLRDHLNEISKFLKYRNVPGLPHEITSLWEAMDKAGIDKSLAQDLAETAVLQLRADELVSTARMEDFVLTRLTSGVISPPLMKPKKNTQVKVAMVGVPGAGKTTVIQKLATDSAGYGNRQVGLITLDTHRIAAIEQLKTFATISKLPLEVIYSPDQVQAAIQRLRARDVILIDTPGIAVRDTKRVESLAKLLDALHPDETHHVMNSQVRDEELNTASDRFRDLHITHLTFTRLDDSSRCGHVVNVARSATKPIAWLSSGQEFVGTIERFSRRHLRDWLHVDSVTLRAN